jgi:hypothetical protein
MRAFERLDYSDPAGIVPDDWQINWGDSTGTEFFDGNSAYFSHTYDAPGTFNVTLNERDANGTYTTGLSATVVDAASALCRG